MPVLKSTYKANFLNRNKHFSTIMPALVRKVKSLPWHSERINTPDDDFLDLDWHIRDHQRLVILCHGLEGNSRRPYMLGMANAFAQEGWSVLSWNYRGCSGEMNRQHRFYHSGATDDLEVIINHTLQKHSFETIALVGFSLGGNIVLKYLGENRARPNQIKRSAAISVPLHLHSSSQKISSGFNQVYAQRFLKKLAKKVREKASTMDTIDPSHLGDIKKLQEFDDHYTAPIHGFKDAIDYYTRCSSIFYLENIHVPALVLNAKDDPMLSEKCFEIEAYLSNPNLFFEFPDFGGHCGFPGRVFQDLYWVDLRVSEFIIKGE